MGGLPIFGGASRHGSDVIVPLDSFHFLVIGTLDAGGYNSHAYLAATVMADDSRAGQRRGQRVQADAIRREGVKLGAIGESLKSWYKDREHVYDSAGGVIPGADSKTFLPLSRDGTDAYFATDRRRVYDSHGAVIPGADPKTFDAVSPSMANDARHIYNWRSRAVKISSVNAPK